MIIDTIIVTTDHMNKQYYIRLKHNGIITEGILLNRDQLKQLLHFIEDIKDEESPKRMSDLIHHEIDFVQKSNKMTL